MIKDFFMLVIKLLGESVFIKDYQGFPRMKFYACVYT